MAHDEPSEDIDAIDFFRDDTTVEDPYPYFDALRARCPVTRESRHGAMKITIDEDRCRGHGVCCTVSPELFDLSDDGYAVTDQPEVPQEF